MGVENSGDLRHLCLGLHRRLHVFLSGGLCSCGTFGCWCPRRRLLSDVAFEDDSHTEFCRLILIIADLPPLSQRRLSSSSSNLHFGTG